MDELSAGEYEELVERVAEFLRSDSSVETVRLKRNVKIRGRATVHQIDVVWEFKEPGDANVRVIFEARRYKRRIEQHDLLAFRGVVDDLSTDELPTHGVMVTTTGYQAGAQGVARTYGIGILNMRRPNTKDWEGRVREIHLTPTLVSARVVVTGIQFTDEVDVETIDPDEATFGGMSLQQYLYGPFMAGEIGDLHTATEAHEVIRRFDPPVLLSATGLQPTGVVAIAGQVSQSIARSQKVVIDGAKRVQWLISNALDGAFIAFGDDGELRIVSATSRPTVAGLAEVAGVFPRGSDDDQEEKDSPRAHEG